MSRTAEPAIIMLVGPSAGGKSFFGERWLKTFPEYERADDLHLVLEYLERENRPRIEDPKVWDDIIVRLAEELAPGKNHIVEFARGHDQNYLRKFGIGEEEVYPRTLRLFLDALDKSFTNSVAIIHVTSSYETRLARNKGRRVTTGQNLPDIVLEDVFREDIFTAEYIDDGEKNPRKGFVRLDSRKIPVVTIKNDEDFSEAKLADRFIDFSRQTMQYFRRRLP